MLKVVINVGNDSENVKDTSAKLQQKHTYLTFILAIELLND